MSDYKQYRAHTAITFLSYQQVEGGRRPKDAAISAVEYADALIAELERTEAQDKLHGILAEAPHMEPELFQAARAEMRRGIGIVSPEPPERRQLSKDALQAIFDSMPNGVSGFCVDWGWLTFARKVEEAHGITGLPRPEPEPEPEPEPPDPDLTRLGTGWKWADTKHVVTPFDFTYSKLSQRQFCGVSGWLIGWEWQSFQPLATPDWHNPEGIESPGEGYRFLVKGEKRCVSTHYNQGNEWFKMHPHAALQPDAIPCRKTTYRTPATRPLPPVLAQDEKEAAQ